mmetsp:Transcript_26775/g.75104  ORF Transcript_26775/g.75104 Transcript_26775/m.75104 type:complete len:94 (+) Transcript_26775:492-773(+)
MTNPSLPIQATRNPKMDLFVSSFSAFSNSINLSLLFDPSSLCDHAIMMLRCCIEPSTSSPELTRMHDVAIMENAPPKLFETLSQSIGGVEAVG